ncbi:MAG: YceD family protein [Alphaproteobacteria bacterium]
MTNKEKNILENKIIVQNINEKGLDVSFSFDEEQLELINTTRIDDENTQLSSFKCNAMFNYLAGSDNILRLSGEMIYTIETICGISLEPLTISQTEELEVDFSSNIKEDDGSDETYLLPELIEKGQIDLYDTVIQELLLSLPRYAYKDGVDISSLDFKKTTADTEAEDEVKKNPFEVLKKLKEKNDKK